MKEITKFEIEDSDYELVNRAVPENPCNKCNNRYGCCGCEKVREREEIIKPLKEAGVFEVQQKAQEVKKLKVQLKTIERIIEADKNFIASKGFELQKIF